MPAISASNDGRAFMAETTKRNWVSDDPSVELSARRTGMSFQRTRLSADRTLMSVIRTSLSLISFGFTIFQVFKKLESSNAVSSSEAARNFGSAMVVLGIIVLLIGIIYELRFMQALRTTRREMSEQGLIHGTSPFPGSFTLLTAILLLGLGVVTILSMIFQAGPFG